MTSSHNEFDDHVSGWHFARHLGGLTGRIREAEIWFSVKMCSSSCSSVIGVETDIESMKKSALLKIDVGIDVADLLKLIPYPEAKSTP